MSRTDNSEKLSEETGVTTRAKARLIELAKGKAAEEYNVLQQAQGNLEERQETYRDSRTKRARSEPSISSPEQQTKKVSFSPVHESPSHRKIKGSSDKSLNEALSQKGTSFHQNI